MNVDAQKLIDQMRRNHAAELERLHFEKALLEVQLQALAEAGAVIVQDVAAPAPDGLDRGESS